MTTLRPSERQTARDTIAGWPVEVVTYRLGERYLAAVEETGAGARIANAEGETRASALASARAQAERRLARTRVRDLEG
jgi:hypothetical protein